MAPLPPHFIGPGHPSFGARCALYFFREDGDETSMYHLVPAKDPWAIQTIERLLGEDSHVNQTWTHLLTIRDNSNVGSPSDQVDIVDYKHFVTEVVDSDRLLSDSLTIESFQRSLSAPSQVQESRPPGNRRAPSDDLELSPIHADDSAINGYSEDIEGPSCDESASKWSEIRGGFFSGAKYALVSLVLGTIVGGYWGAHASDVAWGTFNNNSKILASVFVHALIGTAAGSCGLAVILTLASMVRTLRDSIMFGVPLWAAAIFFWWKGLALGHEVAKGSGLYDSAPLVWLALGPIWVFVLLLPTFLMNLIAVALIARRA